MAEHVILFAGTMGAGKSTAVRSLSDIDVVSTEAVNNDRGASDKPTTTVALDYGEIEVQADEKIRLYGLPGQRRFDFMWAILKDRAAGLLLLVDAGTADPAATVLEYFASFRELVSRGAVAVGVTRTDLHPGTDVRALADAIADAEPDTAVPVISVDPRDREQMRTLLMTLIAGIDAHSAFAGTAGGAGEHA